MLDTGLWIAGMKDFDNLGDLVPEVPEYLVAPGMSLFDLSSPRF
jgi:hypothetical protein